jgi:hypothetical protein
MATGCINDNVRVKYDRRTRNDKRKFCHRCVPSHPDPLRARLLLRWPAKSSLCQYISIPYRRFAVSVGGFKFRKLCKGRIDIRQSLPWIGVVVKHLLWIREYEKRQRERLRV